MPDKFTSYEHCLSLLVYVLLIVYIPTDSIVTLPFGDAHGDRLGPYQNDVITPAITLSTMFPFYGRDENTVYVSGLSNARVLGYMHTAYISSTNTREYKHIGEPSILITVWCSNPSPSPTDRYDIVAFVNTLCLTLDTMYVWITNSKHCLFTVLLSRHG